MTRTLKKVKNHIKRYSRPFLAGSASAFDISGRALDGQFVKRHLNESTQEFCNRRIDGYFKKVGEYMYIAIDKNEGEVLNKTVHHVSSRAGVKNVRAK